MADEVKDDAPPPDGAAPDASAQGDGDPNETVCDACGGPIAPMFYRVRFKASAVNEFLGMHQFFGGRAGAAIVENFAPASCDFMIDLAMLIEHFARRQEQRAQDASAVQSDQNI